METTGERNPRRRSGHAKSTSGCKTCRLKHIKCDELQPECRNCVKHGRRCDYASAPGPVGNTTTNIQRPSLVWPAAIQDSCEKWQQTGHAPFPKLSLPYHPSWHSFSLEDLRYMHHMCTISSSLELSNKAKAALWGSELPRFLRLGCSYDYLAHSIMAMAASHVAWLTKSIEADSIAANYQSLASKGIREAIVHFSRENADAILASSILLSVQVNEWRSYKAVGQGISAVISAMQPWKDESSLLRYLEGQASRLLPAILSDTSPTPTDGTWLEVMSLLRECINSLSALELLVKDRPDLARIVRELFNFAENAQSQTSSLSLAAQYKAMHFLRGWLHRLPSSLVDVTKGDLVVLVTLAHFFAVALTVAPLYPVINHIHFVNIRIAAIVDIQQSMLETVGHVSDVEQANQATMLMAYPLMAVALYQR